MLTKRAFSISFLLLAACVTNANVGGPRSDDDSGSPELDSATSKPPSTSDAASADSADSADASSELQQAYAYANGDVTCTTASDCCVVFDECTNTGLVVSAANESKVVSLLAAFDQKVDETPNADVCTGCIPPPVQVSCVQGKCQGTVVDMTPVDGSTVNFNMLDQNHCGSIPNAPLTSSTGSILHC